MTGLAHSSQVSESGGWAGSGGSPGSGGSGGSPGGSGGASSRHSNRSAVAGATLSVPVNVNCCEANVLELFGGVVWICVSGGGEVRRRPAARRLRACTRRRRTARARRCRWRCCRRRRSTNSPAVMPIGGVVERGVVGDLVTAGPTEMPLPRLPLAVLPSITLPAIGLPSASKASLSTAMPVGPGVVGDVVADHRCRGRLRARCRPLGCAVASLSSIRLPSEPPSSMPLGLNRTSLPVIDAVVGVAQGDARATGQVGGVVDDLGRRRSRRC